MTKMTKTITIVRVVGNTSQKNTGPQLSQIANWIRTTSHIAMMAGATQPFLQSQVVSSVDIITKSAPKEIRKLMS
jgi:hypothetical protein